MTKYLSCLLQGTVKLGEVQCIVHSNAFQHMGISLEKIVANLHVHIAQWRLKRTVLWKYRTVQWYLHNGWPYKMRTVSCFRLENWTQIVITLQRML